MEVNSGPESFSVSKASRIPLELLDHGVDALGSGVGCSGDHVGDDPVEMLFDHPGHFLDRRQVRPNRPAVPFLPAASGSAVRLIVPKAHRMRLDRPGSRRFQVGRLQPAEVFPCLVAHVVRMLQPKVSSLGQR